MLKEMNQLLDIVDYYSNYTDVQNDTQELQSKRAPYRRYGLVENILIFKEEAYYKHSEIIDNLYNKKTEYADTIGKNKFRNQILEYIKEKASERTKFTEEDISLIKDNLLSAKKNKYRVFRDILGVKLNDNEINFGPFMVFYWPNYKIQIEEKYPQNNETMWVRSTHSYMIQLFVESRDQEKAIEKAEALFRKFENVLHIMIGNPDNKFYISITDVRITMYDLIYCFNEDTQEISSSQNLKNLRDDITIEDSYFFNESNICLINFVYRNKKNRYQKEIEKAIQWLGQALRERNIEDGFLKALISLEIILQKNKKEMISPSITYQLAETISFILGNTMDERLNIAKEIKGLYSKRSAIVHSGTNSISEKDYVMACMYSRAIIYELICNPKYASRKYEEIEEIIKKEKYSVCDE